MLAHQCGQMIFMAGLYFHIPFCRRICAYCDFFRSADLRHLDAAVEAMHTEMEEQADFLSDRQIKTIYFGGGTPSLVAPNSVQQLIDHAAKLWDCSTVEELTLEANPDDITKEYVTALRSTAINRISLGVQSFNDEELSLMNRRHSAAGATEAVKRLQDAGIENITIDLIFGVDGFGEEILEHSIEQALALNVQHISAYHLTIEPHTAFHLRLQRGQMRVVDEECSEREFTLLHNRLTAAGYEHYEVSNYARKGFRARHNSSYWHGAQYLGIGTGAHSYNGQARRWSQRSVKEYIQHREYEQEILSAQDHRNEYVMTALRCAEGIDLEQLERRFGSQTREQIMQAAKRWATTGDVIVNDKQIAIPPERFLISDTVIESLFEV